MRACVLCVRCVRVVVCVCVVCVCVCVCVVCLCLCVCRMLVLLAVGGSAGWNTDRTRQQGGSAHHRCSGLLPASAAGLAVEDGEKVT